MAEIIVPVMVVVAAFFSAVLLVLFAVGSLQLVAKLPTSLFPYAFYAMFAGLGISVLLSSRNFGVSGEIIDGGILSNPIASWATRAASLLAMLAALDQTIRALTKNNIRIDEKIILAIAAIFFWISNIIVPAFLAPNTVPPQLTWIYIIIFVMGLIFADKVVAQKSIIAIRNGAVGFCFFSLVAAVVKPAVALQTDYGQGLLGSIPRLFGLAPHAILMGMFICMGIWTTVYFPFRKTAVQWIVMLMLLFGLFMTQAKAVWITLLFSIPVIMAGRNRLPSFSELSNPRYRMLIFAAIAISLLLIFGVLAQVSFGDWGRKIDHFINSDKGAQLTSFTGRDQIWAVAMKEWSNSPIFGYGLEVFGSAHRAKIGMWFAISAHNQIYDNLARTGLVGTLGMVIYAAILIRLSFKYWRQTEGLTVVLMASILLRMISEVPLTMGLMGIDSAPHFLLLCLFAKCRREKEVVQRNLSFDTPRPAVMNSTSAV